MSRLDSLTGMRFWAALLVVMYHLGLFVGEVQPLSWVTQYGRTGVTFFFVLSGFVLAWTYLDRPVAYRVFMWRRFARLWPLVAVTGVAGIATKLLADEEVDPVAALSTFTFLQAWWPSWAPGANAPAWSLSDEAFFYALFPLLLAAVGAAVWRKRLTWIIGVGMLAAWVVFAALDLPAWLLDYFPPARLGQFALGVIAGVAMRRGLRAPIPYIPAVALVVVYHLALIPWGDAVEATRAISAHSGSQWFATPVFVLLIMAAAQADLDGRRTGATGPVVIKLGQWSYALYLVHEIVIRLWVHYTDTPVGVSWAAILLLAVAASAALYHWVEHPAESNLRRMVKPPAPAARLGEATAQRP